MQLYPPVCTTRQMPIIEAQSGRHGARQLPNGDLQRGDRRRISPFHSLYLDGTTAIRTSRWDMVNLAL